MQATQPQSPWQSQCENQQIVGPAGLVLLAAPQSEFYKWLNL